MVARKTDGKSVRDEDDRRRLVDLTRSAGPGSPVARDLEEALAELGIGALNSMASKRQLQAALERVGIMIRVPPPEHGDEVKSVVLIAVGIATPRFMDSFVFGGRWDPVRASLTTAFTTACLYAFAEEYRSFSRKQTARGFEVPTELGDEFGLGRPLWSEVPQNPERLVLDRLELRAALNRLSPRQQDVLLLVAAGHTHAEVASELEMSASQVRSLLRHARAMLRTNRGCEQVNRKITDSADPSLAPSLWERLRRWGIESHLEAAMVKRAIEHCRSSYENPGRPALYRPLENDNRNQLDIILDGMRSGVSIPNRKRWTANSARVCRDVLARVRDEVPSVQRPEGRRKGISNDLRELYSAVTLATSGPRSLAP